MGDIKMKRMKNLVEISSLVTQSRDFFKIKDIIVNKMLEVVHPAKACVNIFYNEDFNYAYLVCSNTLEYIPTVFKDSETVQGARINFEMYPDYIREAVFEQKIVYVKDIFSDSRAEKERGMAKEEGYSRRIVFPLLIKDKTVGFMTAFMEECDSVDEDDIDFISSVASLMALSIEITRKNKSVDKLVSKLRYGVSSINESIKKLYKDNDKETYIKDLTVQATNITESEESLIIIRADERNKRIVNYHNRNDNEKSNLFPLLERISKEEEDCGFINNADLSSESSPNINSYIFCRMKDRDKILGYIVCANASKYTKDDINILSILSKQIIVGIQIYEYNQNEIKNRVLQNELSILNKQQRLMMNDANMVCNKDKELNCYHKPARVVGGDFYDAVKVGNRVLYIVADVMGHGIVSNYMVALLKGAFKVLCRENYGPSEILKNLNCMLFGEFDKMEVFATCLVAEFNVDTNILTVANAGHYSPICIRNDASVERNIKSKKGIPIGVIEDVEYEENALNAADYPMICMFTDGIIEVKNNKKEEFGLERFEKILSENYMEDHKDVVEKLNTELKTYSGKSEYSDDILVVMLSKNLSGSM